MPIVVLVLAFVIACAFIDARTRRIPNALSGPAALAGVLMNAGYFGPSGLEASLLGFGLMIGTLFAPFALGGIGAGDVKMMGAVGALLGVRLAVAGLLAGLIVGGLVMVVHLARLGRLHEKLVATGRMFALAAMARSLIPLQVSATNAESVALPYSVPLALGTISVLVLSTLGAFQ